MRYTSGHNTAFSVYPLRQLTPDCSLLSFLPFEALAVNTNYVTIESRVNYSHNVVALLCRSWYPGICDYDVRKEARYVGNDRRGNALLQTIFCSKCFFCFVIFIFAPCGLVFGRARQIHHSLFSLYPVRRALDGFLVILGPTTSSTFPNMQKRYSEDQGERWEVSTSESSVSVENCEV